MSFYNLYREVISNNLCTTCGACSLVCPESVVFFKETAVGLEPQLAGKCLGEKCSRCVEVCPGARIPRSDIERKLFGRTRNANGLEKTQGVLRKVCIAQWDNEKILGSAASGGLVSGLLHFAMEKGLIDGAVIVGPARAKPWLSQSVVATNIDDIAMCGASRYDAFPHLMGLQAAIDAGLNKVAIVALPCGVAALRRCGVAALRRCGRCNCWDASTTSGRAA